MTIDEIVTKAIPTDYTWVQCPSRKAIETEKALKRREELKERIEMLVENALLKKENEVSY